MDSIRPDAAVSGFISHLLVLENARPAQGFALPLIANSHPSLIFQSMDSGPTASEAGGFPTLSLNGQYVKPVELAFPRRFVLVACFFHAHALKPLFGFEAAEWTDRHIDADLIGPVRDFRLRERLLNAPTPVECARLMRDFVWELMRRSDPLWGAPGGTPGNPAAVATRALLKSNGLLSLPSLQRELRLSERGLQRLFTAEVGVSPRLFGRICRFQSLFRQLDSGRYTRLSDLAYDNGFADQSHMVRVFREFTGQTPGEYLKKRSELVD